MQPQSNYQSNSNHPTTQYKRKRRARDEVTERNFACACGKTYLSYPALYTHIKNKHQGKAPNPDDLGPSMQPVNHTKSMMVTREEPDNEYEKFLSTPDQALVCVINTFRPYSSTKELNYLIDDLFVPFPAELGKELQQAIRHCSQEKVQVQKILDNGIKAVTIDAIMGRFISLLLNKIDKTIIIQFIFVLLIFRRNLNNHFSRQQPTQTEYTKAASGMKMLDNINEFNLYYFDILAEPYRNLIWVFLDRYTNCKTKLNNF